MLLAAYSHGSALDAILGTFIFVAFFLWILLEVLNIRAKVKGYFASRQARVHADETLAEMYTVHEYAGTRSETQRRQRGG